MWKLLLLFFLTGCAQFEATKPAQIDIAIVPYLEQYKIDKKIYLGISYIRKIDIIFNSMSNYEGFCTIYSDGKREIEIDPETWFNGTDDEKTILLYHEMGHCDLDLDHTNGNSIMNPYGMNQFIFAASRNYYLNLLFNKGK